MQDIPTKATGDQLTATEWNNVPDELENSITDTNQTLSGADRHQVSKSMSNYTATGDHYIDAGVADAYVLNPKGSFEAPTELFDGLRARFRVANTNTGVSTINVASLGVKDIKKYGGGADLVAGDLVQDAVAEVAYVQSLDDFELISMEDPIIREAIPLIPDLSGCLLANNGAAPATDVDVGSGFFRSTTTFDVFTNTATFTKRVNATWVQGTNQGGLADALVATPGTWYHVFGLGKPDGTVDFGFDTDLNATNLLADANVVAAGFTLYRKVGSIKLLAASIATFYMYETENGERHTYLKEPITEGFTNTIVDGADATPTSQDAFTPTGISVKAIFYTTASFNAGAPAGNFSAAIYSPFRTAITVQANNIVLRAQRGTTAPGFDTNEIEVITDTTPNVVWTVFRGALTGTAFALTLKGWIE